MPITVTIATLDHFCTQSESKGCGEVLERGDGTTKVRKYIIQGDGQKIPKLFLSREEAVAEAVKLGYVVE